MKKNIVFDLWVLFLVPSVLIAGKLFIFNIVRPGYVGDLPLLTISHVFFLLVVTSTIAILLYRSATGRIARIPRINQRLALWGGYIVALVGVLGISMIALNYVMLEIADMGTVISYSWPINFLGEYPIAVDDAGFVFDLAVGLIVSLVFSLLVYKIVQKVSHTYTKTPDPIR